MNKLDLTASVLVILMAATIPASAENYDNTLKKARASYHNGDNIEAYENLRQALMLVWDDMPLTVLGVKLVEDQKSYTPKKSKVYKSGEPIYMVCQVLGYSIKERNSSNHINIATDFYVMDDEEQILMEKKDFGSFELISPFPNTEFKMDLKYTLNAPPGEYIILTRLRDKNSDKSTEFTKAVVIE